MQQPTGTSAIEWVVAAIGTAVIVAAVAYMVWYGVARPGGPPELSIRQVSEARQVEGSYLVQVEVNNQGHSTAANVQISGALQEGGVSVEESSASIDYVPQQSKRRAYFQFTKDPADYALELRVEGMAKP
ncbi:TIGR02588 family protein [Methyloligella solikamskensis]|uniref:TIGR02588 family protein n=1 Tax=Methyloligella solikamskensis TaxID=1177756 RepID=A0ABW3J8P1_9HYPH